MDFAHFWAAQLQVTDTFDCLIHFIHISSEFLYNMGPF